MVHINDRMANGLNPQNPNPQGAPPVHAPPPARKKTRWLLWTFGIIFGLLLAVVATVATTLWWIQRPIKPVVLSPQERAVVETKLQYVENPRPPAAVPGRPTQDGTPPPVAAEAPQERAQPYVPGAKVVKITQREVNGLLNANTDLGKSVRLEFDKDAVNAYVAVPIPKDFPVLGGRMFRARGRFDISLGNGGTPYAVLEDVTVFGLSLPKAWLGGLKGQNLIADATGQQNGHPVLRGLKSLRVEPGALVIEVED